MSEDHVELSRFTFDGYTGVKLKAGYRGVQRIVPPAGDEYAFGVKKWKREVEVVVSPTGRSVRVYVDGNEIAAPLQQGEPG